jgi:hypothetical protein
VRPSSATETIVSCSDSQYGQLKAGARTPAVFQELIRCSRKPHHMRSHVRAAVEALETRGNEDGDLRISSRSSFWAWAC